LSPFGAKGSTENAPIPFAMQALNGPNERQPPEGASVRFGLMCRASRPSTRAHSARCADAKRRHINVIKRQNECSRNKLFCEIKLT
jgi:hypothetical protein